MSEPGSSQLRRVVRGISRVLGVALVLWALSDDALIGGGPGFGLTQAAVAFVGGVLLCVSFAPLGWNARALALVLSAGFVVGVGEIGVRILFSARYQRPFVLDEDLLYRLAPDTWREFNRKPVNGGDRILYRVNSAGYRGEELETSPAIRIAVFGDSFIQGEFSTRENTFSERLEAHLEARLAEAGGGASKVDVEVVNAGVAGYGPDQALKKMEREWETLAPDLVVMAVFAGNDFGDMLRNKLYRVDEAGQLLENDFTIDADVRRAMDARRGELLVKRVLRDAVQGFSAMTGLGQSETSGVEQMSAKERVEAFREQHIAEYEEYIVNGDDVVREIAWDTYDADVSLTPRSDAARYKARLMEAVLERMQALAASHSTPLVLVPIPHPLDLGGHDSGEIDHARYPDYEARGLVGILESIAERRGIPVVDLFTPFKERGTEALYFQGFDDHWNDAGQDFAGERTAEFLLGAELRGRLVSNVHMSGQGG